MPKLIDIEAVLERVESDVALYDELVEIFFSDSDRILSDIDTSISTRDAEPLRKLSHEIKGALASIGAMTCHAVACSLERASADSDWRYTANLAQELADEIRRFNMAFNEWRATIKPS